MYLLFYVHPQAYSAVKAARCLDQSYAWSGSQAMRRRRLSGPVSAWLPHHCQLRGDPCPVPPFHGRFLAELSACSCTLFGRSPEGWKRRGASLD